MEKPPTSAMMEQKFADYLRTKGLRKTGERFAILDVAVGLKSHFGAETLHGELSARGYHVSLSTVYATIDLLCRAGILRRHIFDLKEGLYELAGLNHIHLVCSHCGKIREIADEETARLLNARRFDSFTPSYFSAVVHGICNNCRRKAKKLDKNK